MPGLHGLLRQALGSALLGGCATVTPASPDAVLSEAQVADMIEHSDRRFGRTVTVRPYPYDNGFSGSYVACFEPCDSSQADRSIFLVYTTPGRFAGYRGDRAEVVRADLRRICPKATAQCLDAPARVFGLHAVDAPHD